MLSFLNKILLLSPLYMTCITSLVFILTIFIWVKFCYFIWLNNNNFIKKKIIKFKIFFAFLGLIASFIAAIGISYKVASKKAKINHDTIILLDVSRSMLAQDCLKETRLKLATNIIEKIVDNNIFGTIGVILFATDFFTLVPATEDRSLIKSLINTLDDNFIVTGETDLKPALKEAIRILMQIDSKKSIIILSDGEFNADFNQEINELINNKITVNCCLIGEEVGAPISIWDTNGNKIGHLKDQNNNIVISKALPDLLKEIAQKSGGKYWSWNDQAQIYNLGGGQKIIDDNLSEFSLTSLSWIFSCIALICFILERFF